MIKYIYIYTIYIVIYIYVSLYNIYIYRERERERVRPSIYAKCPPPTSDILSHIDGILIPVCVCDMWLSSLVAIHLIHHQKGRGVPVQVVVCKVVPAIGVNTKGAIGMHLRRDNPRYSAPQREDYGWGVASSREIVKNETICVK